MLKIAPSNDKFNPLADGSTCNFELDFSFGPTTALLKELEDGSQADLVILTQEAIDRLIQSQVLDGPRVDIASTRIGIGMKSRLINNHPAIDSVESFRSFLVDAPSLAYTSDGVSGRYIAELIERFNLTRDLAHKTKKVAGGYAAELIIKGEAHFAIQNISELLAVPGVQILAPLPTQIQKITTFSGATKKGTKVKSLAVEFLRALQTPGVLAVFERCGLENVTSLSTY